MSEPIRPTPQEAAALKREDLDTVAGAFDYRGGENLSKPGLVGRERIRLRLTDEAGDTVQWYLKRYGGEHADHGPMKCCCPLPPGQPSPARRELENISLAQAAGVPTMRAIAFGEATNLWGAQRSYIVVAAVAGEALERCFDDFLARNGDNQAAMAAFNAALVDLVARLHSARLVHRDLYASHIFLDDAPAGPKLYLIDLARVFKPRWRRFRWRVKDLAQLKYSMCPQWADQYWGGFLEAYLARIGGSRRRLAAAIERKVAAMRRRQRRKLNAR